MNPKDWDRISENYYSEVLSPLKDSEHNPLFDDLKGLSGSVIDLGCGLGELLPSLSKQFSSVIAVDFSEQMLEKAKLKNAALKNVSYVCADLANVKGLGSFDVAISSNSILASETQDVLKILSGINSVLKKCGTFLGIVPSTEVYIYQAKLTFEKKGSVSGLLDEHDLVSGTYTFDGDTQKSFYRFELQRLLRKAGFKNIKIGRVTYPWKEFRRAGQEYYPSEELPWDWYFKCET